MKKFLLTLIFCAFATCADAATCFWVGGTGSWSTANAASWASSSGGTASTCAATGGIPKQAADTATFDGASGGGVVTVDTTMNGTTLTQITSGAFTGTLDFSANNPSMTLTGLFASTGTGTRTINMGSGTFTITGGNTVWDFSNITGLTFNANTSTIVFSGSNGNRGFITSGKSFHTVTISSSASAPNAPSLNFNGSPTITTLNLTAPVRISLQSATTITLTNAPTWAGTSATNPVMIEVTEGGTTGTISVASGTVSCNWCVLQGLTGSGGATFTATNSFGYNTSGITVTGPSGGGGGYIIGG